MLGAGELSCLADGGWVLSREGDVGAVVFAIRL